MKKIKYTLTYDECDIVEEQIKYILKEDNEDNETEEEIKKRVYGDYDLFTNAWDDFQECLSEDLNDIDKNKFKVFKIKGEDMGWLNRTGYKILEAENAEELLNGILPKTDVTLRVRKTKTQIIIICSHHDSPMGEFYYIKPLNKKEFKKYEEEDY